MFEPLTVIIHVCRNAFQTDMSRNSNSGESKYLMYRNIVDTAHEVSKKECLKCSACTLAEHFVDQIPCVHKLRDTKKRQK